MTAPPDLERGIAPLSPPAPAQLLLLGRALPLMVSETQIHLSLSLRAHP